MRRDERWFLLWAIRMKKLVDMDGILFFRTFDARSQAALLDALEQG
jgi:hypothetical protein